MIDLKKFAPYLRGEKFSNGLAFELGGSENEILDRVKVLKELAKDKKVIHIGCADHYDLILEKYKCGRWLHACLSDLATKCIGIDVNQEAITLITNELGFKNVLCLDIVKDDIPKTLSEFKWDIVILGEMLEHLLSPCDFLIALRKKLANYCDELVVTVPNSLSLQNFRMLFKDVELINTDHHFAFSPFTLSKILIDAGFTPTNLRFCNYSPAGPSFYKYLPRPRKFLENQLLKRHPVLRDSILAIASFR